MSTVCHVRLTDEDVKTLDQLARALGADRSKLIRRAVKAFLAEYTGEPNLHKINEDVKDLMSRMAKVETILNGLQHRDHSP